MKLISKTTIKVKDLLYPDLYTDTNFLYSKPELFECIYGIPYSSTHIRDINVKSERNSSHMIKVRPDRKIITFVFDDGTSAWENKKVHNLRKEFMNTYKNIGLNMEYMCGYIQGLHSPILGAYSKGMMSANNFDGYQFWQKLYIL